MQRLLDADLSRGAFGLSSGLEYVPGLYAETPELVALARTVGARRGVVMSHMRSEDDDKIERAIDELIAQGRHAHVHISHLKVVLGHGAARGQGVLDKIARTRAAGIDLTADVYPYNGGYADITLVFPVWAKTVEQLATAQRERGQELADFVRARIVKRNGPDAILIAEGPYAGRTLTQAAAKAGKPFWQFAIENLGTNGWNCAHFTQDEAIQELFAVSPLVAISTDGAPWITHPRSWATYPKVLGEFVRDRKLLTLEAAVHKMTGLAARCVGLADRGRIAPGAAADLVVFDPAMIAPHATWTTPRAPATGIDCVIVGGAVAVDHGEMTTARSGSDIAKGNIVMLRWTIPALAALTLLGGTASAAPRKAAAPAQFAKTWRDLSAVVTGEAAEEQVVGGTIAFRANGRTLGSSSFGYADLDTKRAATADTLYHWASMTKMLTAVALLQLRDAGKVSLDDPIVKYLPELRQVHDGYGTIEQITLKMLLNHSSGFRGPTFPWGGTKPWHPHEPADWSQVAAMTPYSDIEFQPGSKYSYSNPGVSFLGRVIEIVSGENYQQYIEKHILWPLDMRKTYFDITPPYMLPLAIQQLFDRKRAFAPPRGWTSVRVLRSPMAGSTARSTICCAGPISCSA